MRRYLRNAFLVGVLCHLMPQACRSQNLFAPDGSKLKGINEYQWLNSGNVSHAALDSFLRNMSAKGLGAEAVMSKYKQDGKLCIQNFNNKVLLRHPSNERYNQSKFNRAVRAVSIEKFLSTAVQLCREAQLSSHEIVSVGCGDGTIEREVIAAYRDRFNSDVINITLVDPAHKVDYKYFPDLIKERPEVVGNCSLLIIWPEMPLKSDGYDLDAIRKLRPRTLLAVYEINGVTGSPEFLNFMRNDNYKLSADKYGLKNIYTEIYWRLNAPRDPNNYGVIDKYETEEDVVEEIFCNEFMGTDIVRMVKLKRVD